MRVRAGREARRRGAYIGVSYCRRIGSRKCTAGLGFSCDFAGNGVSTCMYQRGETVHTSVNAGDTEPFSEYCASETGQPSQTARTTKPYYCTLIAITTSTSTSSPTRPPAMDSSCYCGYVPGAYIWSTSPGDGFPPDPSSRAAFPPLQQPPQSGPRSHARPRCTRRGCHQRTRTLRGSWAVAAPSGLIRTGLMALPSSAGPAALCGR